MPFETESRHEREQELREPWNVAGRIEDENFKTRSETPSLLHTGIVFFCGEDDKLSA